MPQQQISLDGLPEPVARAIEVAVQMARRLAASDGSQYQKSETVKDLPRWKGQVIGNLSRNELYDDV